MHNVSKKMLTDILTRGLRLREPRFVMERWDDKWNGSIISPSFRGKGDFARQQAIWTVLEKGLGAKPFRFVGMLLAYTPQEWNWNFEEDVANGSRRKAKKSAA